MSWLLEGGQVGREIYEVERSLCERGVPWADGARGQPRSGTGALSTNRRRKTVKTWETINLLLECQRVHQRLADIERRKRELERQAARSRASTANAGARVRELEGELAAIRRDERTSESAIGEVQSRKTRLQSELAGIRSNTRYRQINEELARCEQTIQQIEEGQIALFQREEAKEMGLQAAKNRLAELVGQQSQHEREAGAKLEEFDSAQAREIECLRQLKAEFPDGDQSLRCFNRLIGKGKLDAIVEVNRNVCPGSGCHLAIPPGLRQEACALDHVVTCWYCGRIIFSVAASSLHSLSSEDIQKGRLSLSPQLALALITDVVRIRDVWDNWHTAKAEGNWLAGLTELFAVHALGEGDKVRLLKIGNSDDYRFAPELVSDVKLDRIVKVIRSSDQPLRLANIVAKHLTKKAAVYRAGLLICALRSRLGVPGIYFQADVVWHKPLLELPKPTVIPPPTTYPPEPAVRPPPMETTVRLTDGAIEAGVFQIPATFRTYFASVSPGEMVTVGFGVSEDLAVEFDANALVLKGEALRRWYQSNGLEPGDRVTLAIRDIGREVFHIHTEWRRDLNYLLEQARKGPRSYTGRPRDLLYGLLAEVGQPLHYRDLWSRAANLSGLRIGTVVSTLSRYNRRLFCNVGGGRWGLVEWPGDRLDQERQSRTGNWVASPLSIPDEQSLWKAIHEIEEQDLVYKLLKRTGCDMSYPEIARTLAEILSVNAAHLTETSFVNVRDNRLQKLANGSWTLREFVPRLPPPSPLPPRQPPRPLSAPVIPEPRTSVHHTRRLWYSLAALTAVAVLVWFLATR